MRLHISTSSFLESLSFVLIGPKMNKIAIHLLQEMYGLPLIARTSIYFLVNYGVFDRFNIGLIKTKLLNSSVCSF